MSQYAGGVWCAWHDGWMREPTDETVPPSHGICPDCEDQLAPMSSHVLTPHERDDRAEVALIYGVVVCAVVAMVAMAVVELVR